MASGITNEKLKQIEESRRNALEKLSRKRNAESACVLPSSKRSIASSSRAEPKSFKKKLTAVFSLISQNRFTIDVLYDKELIDIFKGIPSRQYGQAILTLKQGVVN